MAAQTWRNEVIETREEEGRRAYRYQHVSPDGIAAEPQWADERIEPMSREILEDRWEGLMLQDSDPTKLQNRLDNLLVDLSQRLIRRSHDGTVHKDGEFIGVDYVMDVDGLEGVIRDWLIERAAGVAR